jgi:hypothetical protein
MIKVYCPICGEFFDSGGPDFPVVGPGNAEFKVDHPKCGNTLKYNFEISVQKNLEG